MPSASPLKPCLPERAVPSLADTQARLRRAVVTGDTAGIGPDLVGGRYPEERLAIHHRNYETSLVAALLGKFPATAWLVGTPFLTQAAERFVRERPPQAPCVAEYGEDFPAYLSRGPGAERVPYLQDFAQLEWHVGHVAVAVDFPCTTVGELSRIEIEALTEGTLRLQPGLRYLQAQWPIDDLMKMYLTDNAPEQLTLAAGDVWIEVRGARGAFQINPLDAGEFSFRRSILNGRSIGDAAVAAIGLDASFEPGRALAALVTDGLVTASPLQLTETHHDDR
jgi:hypothetical protein